MTRLWRTIAWVAAAVVLLVVVAVGAMLFAWSRQDHSPFDYGPLRGTAISAPKSAPTSSVRTSTFVVECQGRAGLPVVITSRGVGGAVIGAWRIGPVMVSGKVLDAEPGPAEVSSAIRKRSGWVIHGAIGGEHATYYFDDAGRLTQYYISW